mmetsp:Transcript_12273/g.22102  ORF Transcript_12273/g.22102 Transcript_12273/m.22102 type:complete len:212 (+) Transcript_12273:180-815(+)|eukprot:CAMPEP_0196144286 /NCGR_PEP_ID=MMETSP0910-20130528/15742_1 /TAXON_ID=49265 /ORGANISM="Thalassiosira rotula, Strain GSO102" /LENGTH=211 /DNA_ID=CAMNT_0041405901 /DNA_START=86 /DNA_END=721 /DNA_ORIENTATION=+
MNLSLLMTALALPLAASETMSWGTDKSFTSILTDVTVDEHSEDRPIYCFMPPPNPRCYINEYAACCTLGNCPEKRPSCECGVRDCRRVRPGQSYCTWSPNYDCYQTGWPQCCSEERGKECPSELQRCDVLSSDSLITDSDSDSDQESEEKSWDDTKRDARNAANKTGDWTKDQADKARDWGRKTFTSSASSTGINATLVAILCGAIQLMLI